MKNHLKTYTFILKTLSPVFIGSGKEITKKEYIYVPNGHRVIMPDFNKFSEYLVSENLIEDYTNFMIGSGKDLYEWMRRRNIGLSQFDKFKAYELNAGDAIIPGLTLSNVQLFIKNSQGNPYIPGSSLKGALRTAVLARMIDDSKNEWIRYFNRLEEELMKIKKVGKKDPISKITEEIENRLLHTLNFDERKLKNAVNSVFKAIQVSDSLPLDSKDLILCAKIDVSREGKTKQNKAVCRECIKPGVEITFRITLDTQLLMKSNINMDFILSSIQRFCDLQHKYFISKFSMPPNADKSQAKSGPELYLGGGAGYVSKTFVYPLGGEKAMGFVSELLNKQFFAHKHYRDKEYGVSPRMLKCTKYNGKLYLMGRCECRVME